jgi:predicted phage terminase large subunit-like protein
MTSTRLGWESRRRTLQLSLLEFGMGAFEHVEPYEYVHGKHAEVMASYLEAVARKEISRLLINIPPSCSKSYWLNIAFPAWVWTWDPTARFQAFAYVEQLAIRDQLKCRQLIASEWYRSYFPEVKVKHGQDHKVLFALEAGGERRIGVPGGGLSTGSHPSFILGDDLLSAMTAESAAVRRALHNWYFETMSTRGMARGAAHVLASQRLHVDDLSGAILERHKKMLAEHGTSPWHFVMLPMRYEADRAMVDSGHGGDWRTEEGQLLFPELMDEAAVTAVERNLGPHGARCQLQQDAKRRDGALFKTTRVQLIQESELPPLSSFDEVVRFWDLAGTDERENSEACYTAGAAMGRVGRNKFYLFNMKREQIGGDEVEDLMEATIHQDESRFGYDKIRTVFEREPGSSGKRVAELICRRLRKHRISAKAPKGKKEVRAEPLSAAVGRYEFYVVVEEGTTELMDEMTTFPGGKYKDQIDAMSGAYLELCEGEQGKPMVARSKSSYAEIETKPCRNQACNRPAFAGDYCCASCESAHKQAGQINPNVIAALKWIQAAGEGATIGAFTGDFESIGKRLEIDIMPYKRETKAGTWELSKAGEAVLSGGALCECHEPRCNGKYADWFNRTGGK